MSEKFLLSSVEHKVTKNGKDYSSGYLMSTTAKVPLVMWDNLIPKEWVGKVVSIDGNMEEYGGANQMKVLRINLEPTENPLDYLVRSPYDDEKLKANYNNLVGYVKTDWIRELLRLAIENEPRFFTHPAAKTVHQAYVGGLAEHSEKVAMLSYRAATLYDRSVDVEITVAAALLHDIGKLDELTNPPEFDYTYAGNALGHPLLGCLRVAKCRDQLACEVEEKRYMKLLNCIASHPGLPEYGAITSPKCAEASIVSSADMIDSKVEQFIELSAQFPEDDTAMSKFMGGTVLL